MLFRSRGLWKAQRLEGAALLLPCVQHGSQGAYNLSTEDVVMTTNTTTEQIQYQPGDVANGYRLAEDGITWEPIGQIQVPSQPEKKTRRWLPWAIGAGVVVLGIGALAGGGAEEQAVVEAEAAAEAAIAEAEAQAEEAIAEAEAAAAEAEAAAQAEAEGADTDEQSASAVESGDSFSTQSFVTDARNNLGDLREDVSDAQSALAEGRAVGLGWNFAEIAFNTAQLGALTAPDSIASEWEAAIAGLNTGLDAATDRKSVV